MDRSIDRCVVTTTIERWRLYNPALTGTVLLEPWLVQANLHLLDSIRS